VPKFGSHRSSASGREQTGGFPGIIPVGALLSGLFLLIRKVMGTPSGLAGIFRRSNDSKEISLPAEMNGQPRAFAFRANERQNEDSRDDREQRISQDEAIRERSGI